MSADNFVYLFQHPNGGYCFLENQSASWFLDDQAGLRAYAQREALKRNLRAYESYDEALDDACEAEMNDYHEYGVMEDDEVYLANWREGRTHADE